MERIKTLLQSLIGGVLPDVLGRGPGFVAFALVQAGMITFLLLRHVDGGGIGMAFGSLNAAFFGAGAWKAHSDNKVAIANGGSGNGNDSSDPRLAPKA